MVFNGAVPLDMTKYPARCIGRLWIFDGSDSLEPLGTGVLVSNNQVLTASRPIRQEGALTVRFAPGWNGPFKAPSTPFGVFTSTSILHLPTPAQFRTGPSAINLALVTLNGSPGATLGWFGWQESPNPGAYIGNFLATGYADEKFDSNQAFTWPVPIQEVFRDTEDGETEWALVTPGYADFAFVGAPLWHLDAQLLPAINGIISGNGSGRTVHAGGPLMGSWLTANEVGPNGNRGTFV